MSSQLALALANARYWPTVAPVVRERLGYWEERAEAIPDPSLRALALDRLRAERFNAEVAATLATLAPRARRRAVSEAIVALQVAYDYLDALGEQVPGQPPRPRDGGYARELLATVKSRLAALPSADAVSGVACARARRCADAQMLVHAAARGPELDRWAGTEAAGTGLGAPELLAGASASVLCLHALIAAAADERTSRADAAALDALYLSIAALTMLDSLIDRDEDAAAGRPGYAERYDSREQMAERLAAVARAALGRARALPHSDHHAITLMGVVAYYASAPAARDPDARAVLERVRAELGPGLAPVLAVMRAWRLAKRLTYVFHRVRMERRGRC